MFKLSMVYIFAKCIKIQDVFKSEKAIRIFFNFSSTTKSRVNSQVHSITSRKENDQSLTNFWPM